jgi:hypothetical protein
MKAIRTAHIQHKNWRSELTAFLRTYRSTPHTTTLFTPFRLMFDREPKTKLPQLQNNTKHAVITQPQTGVTDLMQHDQQAKQKMKAYADKKNHAVHSDILPGDYVLAKQQKENKLSTPFNPSPMVVTGTNGSMITAQSLADPNKQLTRNSCRFRKLKHMPQMQDTPVTDADTTDKAHMQEPVTRSPATPTAPQTPVHPPSPSQLSTPTRCRKRCPLHAHSSPVHTTPVRTPASAVPDPPPGSPVAARPCPGHSAVSHDTALPRRSERTHKPPSYLSDYVPK